MDRVAAERVGDTTCKQERCRWDDQVDCQFFDGQEMSGNWG